MFNYRDIFVFGFPSLDVDKGEHDEDVISGDGADEMENSVEVGNSEVDPDVTEESVREPAGGGSCPENKDFPSSGQSSWNPGVGSLVVDDKDTRDRVGHQSQGIQIRLNKAETTDENSEPDNCPSDGF